MEILEKLKKYGLTISSAESLTGGLLASTIVNVSGISKVYKEGFITYSNEAKINRLQVKKSTLDKYGAISKNCAIEMVNGLINNTKTDIGIATTGIAGPDSEEKKNIGLVYISCRYKGKVICKEFKFSGNRQKIRENTVVEAIKLIEDVVDFTILS